VVRLEHGMFARLYYVTLVDALLRLSGAPDKPQ